MGRVVVTLVVFFVAMNALAGVMEAQGIDDAIGVDASVGDDSVQDAVPDQGSDVASGAPTGQTLFGMYNVLSGQLSSLFKAIYPGLAMLERALLPGWLVYGFLSPLMSLVIFVGIVSFMRGYNL